VNRAVLLEQPPVRWECPSCGLQDVTPAPAAGQAHSRMHACPALAGFLAPMVQVHGRELTGVVHRVVERGDYIAGEQVRLDGNGRPIMAVVTERADGHDTHVFAPTATARTKEL
jgi:hypothetical protein